MCILHISLCDTCDSMENFDLENGHWSELCVGAVNGVICPRTRIYFDEVCLHCGANENRHQG